DADLPWAAFGENLTTVGLVETEVRVGDEYRVGTARLVVTQPRLPCFKLGIRFGDQRMVKRFREAGRPGIYFAVAEEGDSAAGGGRRRTRRDAISEALGGWMATVEHTHYIIGSVVGPRPSPTIVRDFQARIGAATKRQCREQLGRLPDAVVACVGGGSNAAG